MISRHPSEIAWAFCGNRSPRKARKEEDNFAVTAGILFWSNIFETWFSVGRPGIGSDIKEIPVVPHIFKRTSTSTAHLLYGLGSWSLSRRRRPEVGRLVRDSRSTEHLI